MDGQLQEQITMTLLKEIGVPMLKGAAPPVWAWIRGMVFRRPDLVPPPAVDFTKAIKVRLRGDTDAIQLDLSDVPSVRIDFEIINLSDIDLVLDRIVLTLWNGQVVPHGVMPHRYPIPARDTTSTICFMGSLSDGAAAHIRKNREAILSGTSTATSTQLQVGARAYFDSPTLSFALEGWNLTRPLVMR